MEEVVSVLVKVGNYTNVQVSIAHNMWQVPVRSEGDQPRDLLNALLASGKCVELIVALDGQGAKQLAGYGRVADKQIAAPRPGSKSCAFGFSWSCVFRQRGPLLPYSHVSHVLEKGVPAVGLPNFSVLSQETAASLRRALDGAVVAAEEAAARRREQVLQIDATAQDAPLSAGVVAEVLERIKTQLGKVLLACWNAPARYGIPGVMETEEPLLFVVYQAPIERVFSLKQPSLSGGSVFVAMELSQFISLVSRGSVKAVEVVCLEQGSKAIVFEDTAIWGQFRKISSKESAALVTTGVVDAIFDAADGRSGLKGIRAELARASRQGVIVDKSISIRLHKRLAEVERLLLQVRNVMDGKPLPVVVSSEAIVDNFRLDLNLRLARAVEEAERCKSEWQQARSVTRNKVDSSLEAEIGKWLLDLRLATVLLPSPLTWRSLDPERKASSSRLLQACPWPLLVLANRVTPTTFEHRGGKQLLGVFAGDAKQWLSSPAMHQAGERGWGELCIRGGKSDYVLYELGRFAEMIVWGNPFVLELVLIESCKGGKVLHSTREWRDLVAQFTPENLLTARAIMQIMSTVQAQMKLLIANGKPFGEEFVAVAELLHLARKVVVESVGHSQPDVAEYNEWSFWREPVAVLQEESKPEQQHHHQQQQSADRDGPACMPTNLVDVEVNVEVDKTSLRECLVELDELRPKWSAPGVFPDATTVQQRLDAWLVPIRLASLN